MADGKFPGPGSAAALGTGVWLAFNTSGTWNSEKFAALPNVLSEQRQIVINNLAIRRATAELKVTSDYEQMCRILVAALNSNDFDAFELTARLLMTEHQSWMI